MPSLKKSSFYGFIGLLLIAVIGGIVYMARIGGGTLPVVGQAPIFSADEVVSASAPVTASTKPIAMTSFNGKIVLITWYYTHCVDECPLTMFRFEQIQDALKKDGLFGKKVVLIAMTLDPTRDTPPVITEYASHFHADAAGWYFLRATPTNTRSILKQFGILVKPSTNPEFIEHVSKTELIDANGNIRAQYNTANLNTTTILNNIHSLVARENWQV